MGDTQATGAVAALWRFPVKSMQGEVLDQAEVGPTGVLGDRGYALVVADTGKVVSAKHPKVGTALLRCRAKFVHPPKSADDLPPVRITLPSGEGVTSDAPGVDATLSDYLGLGVRLARSAPDDFTIDQYHPDVDDLDPEGHRDEITESKLGSAFFAAAGMASPVPEGAFFDLFPMSVITTATLDRLGALQPATRFDARRFRMNVVVRTDEEGFPENGWIGQSVQLGDQVSLGVALADPRCVMTTLEQEDLPRDTEVLRTLARHNRLEVVPGARYPCAGVYAVVGSPGMVTIGDAVAVT
ncbi:MAG: MOSC domain-containing protein [Actinomycetota bacterium]